jgi:hypothetical protein
VLAVAAPAVGAVVGFVVGVALSVYVARLDLNKRQAGTRTRAEYRGSLFLAPALLAGSGALVALGVSKIL